MSAVARAALAAMLLVALAAPVVAGPAPATPDRPPADKARGADAAAARRYFTDVVLIDHDGRERRLYTDLLQGKAVVAHSFYTSCTASCPVVMATMARLQAELGDRVGRDVHLLSVTSDPTVDTPARLKEYAARVGARPGWFLLSGDPGSVQLALRKLGDASAVKEAHSNVLVIGNERTGLWKKAFALARPDELVRLVRGVVEDR